MITFKISKSFWYLQPFWNGANSKLKILFSTIQYWANLVWSCAISKQVKISFFQSIGSIIYFDPQTLGKSSIFFAKIWWFTKKQTFPGTALKDDIFNHISRLQLVWVLVFLSTNRVSRSWGKLLSNIWISKENLDFCSNSYLVKIDFFTKYLSLRQKKAYKPEKIGGL